MRKNWRSDSDRLKPIKVCIAYNRGKYSEIPLMAEAILYAEQIAAHLKKFPSARAGICRNKSPNNLIWVIRNILSPFFEKLSIEKDKYFLEVENQLDPLGTSESLFRASQYIKNLSSELCISDQIALNFVRDVLGFIEQGYSVEKHNTKSSTIICSYCYRESNPGTDLCHVHQDDKRPRTGDKFQLRFNKLKLEIRNKNLFQNVPGKIRDHLPLTVEKIKTIQFDDWSLLDQNQHKDWLNQVLKVFDICPEKQIALKANELLEIYYTFKESNPDFYSSSNNDDCWYWPFVVRNNMILHEVYELVKLPSPQKNTIKQLSLAWNGMKPAEVARSVGVSRQNICKRLALWEGSIKELRSRGVKDEVIMLLYGINVLPQAD